MNRNAWKALAVAAVLMLTGGDPGCDRFRNYNITMSLVDGGVSRRLVVHYPGMTDGGEPAPDSNDADDAERLRELYGMRERQFARDEDDYVFHGVFPGTLPADVLAPGWVQTSESPLGRLVVYQQRVGGDDDQVAVLHRLQEASDRAVNEVMAWFELELKGHPGFPKLRDFLNTTFRRDLMNCVLYVQLHGTGGAHLADGGLEMDGPQRDATAWLSQYLAEHGYMPTDGHTLMPGRGSEPAMLVHAARLVAGKLGVPASAPLPKELDFLSTLDAATASLKRYARTTNAYRTEVAKLMPRDAGGADAMAAVDADVLFGLGMEALGWLFSSGVKANWEAAVEIRLALPKAPYQTNGHWLASEHQVAWFVRASDVSVGPPPLPYALAAEPDEAFQKLHFGKTAVRDADLGAYITLRDELDPSERAAWDAFVDALRPGKDLCPTLKEALHRGVAAASTSTDAGVKEDKSSLLRDRLSEVLCPKDAKPEPPVKPTGTKRRLPKKVK